MRISRLYRFLFVFGVVILGLSEHAGAQITNPLMPDSLIFITREFCNDWNHMVVQYEGWTACKTGALYMMTGARSATPRITNILTNSTVQNGRLAGKKLVNGGFLSLDLSYDAKTILFAWVEEPKEGWTQRSRYHIFKASVDGTGLTQLTDGLWNDFDPCWLPNGRIVFISERRGGYGRCHTSGMPTYTLYSIKDDGSDTICLSYHETNEWHPSVNNDGMIVYTRWDYLDRDDCIAHHMWICYPDGRDPRAPHGNYPQPWSTMTGTSFQNGRLDRPDGEWHIRAVPNSSKYVAIASGHHQQSYGDVIIIDPSIPDDNKVSQITRITRTFGDPGWGEWGDQMGRYSTPWPLSQDYFLCSYYDSSIVLLNANGTSQTVYKAADGRPLDPIPLRARTKPPTPATATWQGERASLPDHKRATMSVMNVNYGDQPLPAGTVIKSMRIMQIIPKTTCCINGPQTGYASEGLARVSLGTVPVEADGSVYCEAPVGKDIYFQLLDEKGMAVMSMRSLTYVHAGEQLTCYGCHEDKWKATPAANPIATRRAPSPLTPEAGAEFNGVTPINYARLVKPVFDGTCAPCHKQRNQGPTDMSYDSLYHYAFWFCSKGTGDWFLNGDIATPIYGGSRTTPGMFGAAYSRMGKALLNQTHQAAGITSDEFRRVTLWLDGNSMELSAYWQETEQRAGQLVWPDLDYDPQFPTGVETNQPLPGSLTGIASRLRPGPLATGDRPVVRNRLLELRNPCQGPVRIVVTDASGRLVVAQKTREAVISARLPSGARLYFVSIYGPGMRPIGTAQVLSMN